MYQRRSNYSRGYARPSYPRSRPPARRSYGRPMYRTQAARPAYGARAGFARRRMTRRFTVGGSRW